MCDASGRQHAPARCGLEAVAFDTHERQVPQVPQVPLESLESLDPRLLRGRGGSAAVLSRLQAPQAGSTPILFGGLKVLQRRMSDVDLPPTACQPPAAPTAVDMAESPTAETAAEASDGARFEAGS